MTPWPDAKIEATMLADADACKSEYGGTPGDDMTCHIRALLARVRELEAASGIDPLRLEWLLRCEAAIKSMSAQFVCPRTTPEEMVDQILKGEEREASSAKHEL